jgi:DNA-binding response OmpR family regulator
LLQQGAIATIVKPFLKRVLFVDDEPNIRATLPPILRRYGFTVTTAASVEHAVEKIENGRFDLLLCDLNIEHEADGLEVIRAMQHAHPDCVVIVLTGCPSAETAIEGLHLHVDDYITKPADANTLVALMADKLAARKPNARILTVASDEPVLRLWTLYLETRGYEVVSAVGLSALEVCKRGNFDLFILGGTVSDVDKKKLVEACRQCCPVPIISVVSNSNARADDGADYHVKPDVDEILKLVSDVIKKSRSSMSKSKGEPTQLGL